MRKDNLLLVNFDDQQVHRSEGGENRCNKLLPCNFTVVEQFTSSKSVEILSLKRSHGLPTGEKSRNIKVIEMKFFKYHLQYPVTNLECINTLFLP